MNSEWENCTKLRTVAGGATGKASQHGCKEGAGWNGHVIEKERETGIHICRGYQNINNF